MKVAVHRKSKQSETQIVEFDDERVNIATLFRDIEKYAPPELLDELSAVGDTLEQMAWKCGWKTDELYRTLEANSHKQNYLAVCYYVASTRLRNHRSANTVKSWALTARFFHPKIAKKYGNDILPFSVFTYAASFGMAPFLGEDTVNPFVENKTIAYVWEAVLAYAQAMYYESGYGKAPSVEKLKEIFEGQRGTTKSGSKHIDTFVPDANTAMLPSPDLALNEEQFSLDTFLQALQIVTNGLPKLGSKFPKLSQFLSGIALQLSKAAEAIEHGVDLDED